MYVCPECGEPAELPGACTRDGALREDGSSDSFLGLTMGSYRVTRLIGAGGMGRVYRAVQPEIGGRVAIKVLSEATALEPRFQERFFAEARAVNLIRHEKIVNIVDLARLPDGRPYIVMEYLDGAPLSAVFRKRGSAPLTQVAFVRIMLEVLDGVGAAHDKGVVHRDLKPDNIFVSPNGHATVLDFGIAKLAEAEATGITQTGALLGTPKYMSPEQVMGIPADARADVYSLGVILYEGVVGVPPFASGPTFELMRQHVEDAPTPPSELRADIPSDLERVIMRALDKQPERRFLDAHDMRRALLASMGGFPQDSADFSAPGIDSVAVVGERTDQGQATRTAPPRTPGPTPAPPMVHGDTGSLDYPRTIANTGMPTAQALVTRPSTPMRTTRGIPVWAIAVGLVTFVAVGTLGASFFLTTRTSAIDGKTSGASKVKPAPSSDDEASAVEKEEKPVAPSSAPTSTEAPHPTLAELANFDIKAWIPQATAMAKARFYDDVELAIITAAVELPTGKVDLTKQGSVIYYFISPSQRTADEGCASSVVFQSSGVTWQRYGEALCDRRFPPLPRCSLAQAVKKAQKDPTFKAAKSSSGWVSYFDVQTIGVRWNIASNDGKTALIEDDCP